MLPSVAITNLVIMTDSPQSYKINMPDEHLIEIEKIKGHWEKKKVGAKDSSPVANILEGLAGWLTDWTGTRQRRESAAVQDLKAAPSSERTWRVTQHLGAANWNCCGECGEYQPFVPLCSQDTIKTVAWPIRVDKQVSPALTSAAGTITKAVKKEEPQRGGT